LFSYCCSGVLILSVSNESRRRSAWIDDRRHRYDRGLAMGLSVGLLRLAMTGSAFDGVLTGNLTNTVWRCWTRCRESAV